MPESNLKKFNHLKIHTQYSICEGAIKIDELKDYAKELKISALGMCDTSNLCGAVEFSDKLSKVGTQPIIGTQINFKFNDTVGLLPLFALDFEGYKKIIELSSRSYLENDDLSDPHLDINDLLKKQITPNRLILFATHNRFLANKSDCLLEMVDGRLKSINARI